MTVVSRRSFVNLATVALAAPLVWSVVGGRLTARAATIDKFEVNLTPAQWKAKLSPAAFAVLREEGTETPFTSPLNDEHRVGTFACAGCALPLFASATKFDSHTGWPSFWAPLKNAVRQREDGSLGMTRTEIHCRRCGGHLGHVFDDGPKPTGLRYCMNGVAMTFATTRA
ncbi:peptide-methionine (R)-S-oxide reductase MsrB [Polymorphobacter sp. PAMC 29334]|uniref:peptide-methionine (R)-S-oxide reductase MsrB n=1 Tax=Polymorphobacter sp. PAMC 29334 TaxID=2862331 RepID=UPI001C78C1A7|nr:peptide-methionine (R)-S-oxide reductase MsrB [Polymorphobacter sp. PAMC 29334]QYE34100.1 peptide-methionine (R)-S-oxide reductase MsrB [Polymorphobacter sp. PAMC 29334]